MKFQTVSLLLGLAHLALSTSVSQNGKCGVAYGRSYTCLRSSKISQLHWCENIYLYGVQVLAIAARSMDTGMLRQPKLKAIDTDKTPVEAQMRTAAKDANHLMDCAARHLSRV